MFFIGLGSNVGRRAEQLRQALVRLDQIGVEVLRCSSLYETAPFGPVQEQPHFLNAAAELRYPGDALALLRCCLQVEREMGRRREVPMGPRCIDLDILLAGTEIIDTPRLTVPHPGLIERAFALLPLLELEPQLTDPRDGLPLSRHVERVCHDQSVRRLEPQPGVPSHG